MIPFYGALGAAISSIIAEISVTIFQIVYLRKVFDYKKIIIPFIRYLIVGGLMFSCVYLLSIFVFESSILNSFILVIIGIFIYFTILLVIRDKILIDYINKFKSLIMRFLKR